MDEKIIDIYDFQDFDDADFDEALSDLRQFGVNENELNLNYRDIDDEHSN